VSASYCELVVEGPFILVKGFLVGFWSCTEPRPRYFLHRKSGIRRETLRDVLGELFEWENLVHICLEKQSLEAFQKAVDLARPVIGIKVRSVGSIRGASFDFSFQVFNRALADECKKIFGDLPEDVDLVGWNPTEEITDEARKESLSGYVGVHPYAYTGKATVRGECGGVVDLYLRCKRSKARDFILTGEITLDLADSS
jgi:hypothetical protein